MRLGIIGCGEMALFMALFAKLNRPRIELVACCNRTRVGALAYAKACDIRLACDDWVQMLDLARPNAVYVAVPHDLHLSVVESCASRGIHVFLEKPLAATVEQGRALVDIAASSGIKVGINYQLRYAPSPYALARAAQRGELGKIESVRCNIPWRRTEEYFMSAPWRGSRARAGGGTLLTQGSHALDFALWACAGKPVAAQGAVLRRRTNDVDVEGLAQAIIELEGGSLIQINSTLWANPGGPLSIELYGSHGTGQMRCGVVRSSVAYSGVRGRISRPRPPSRGVTAHAKSLEAFRAWVESDGPPHLVSPQSALLTLRCIDAVYRSAEKGMRQRIWSEDGA